jgi:hypothetical protein
LAIHLSRCLQTHWHSFFFEQQRGQKVHGADHKHDDPQYDFQYQQRSTQREQRDADCEQYR